VIPIHIIDVIGYSGSGKTTFIIKLINLFNSDLKYKVAVIKNVKHHMIDERGKDSYLFTEAGASYSIISNVHNEIAIFMKSDKNMINDLIEWLKIGPYKLDFILTEGFRNLGNPTVLCASNLEEIEEQLTKNIRMITGLISSKEPSISSFSSLPIIDIKKDFDKFMKIFNIK
jgi:molybdopterin-guanine dinucleotide biosynthesis protein B